MYIYMVQHKNNAEHQRTYRYKNYQNYSRQLLINRVSNRKAYLYKKAVKELYAITIYE